MTGTDGAGAAHLRLVPPTHARGARPGRPTAIGALALAAPFAGPPPASSPAAAIDDDEGIPAVALGAPRQAAQPPDAKAAATVLAQGLVEVLGGRRDPQQVRGWLDDAVFAWVCDRWRTARRGTSATTPCRVRSVRVCRLQGGAVEAVAVLDDGVRCRAMVLRLETALARWVCTVLTIV